MFETLTKGFRNARQRLQGLAELDEANIDAALRDVRLSLLEADVELGVVKRFLTRVKDKAIGDVMQTTVVHRGRTLKVGPAERFIQICNEELTEMMSSDGEPLRFAAPPGLTGIMMVGLQGSGKTTTAAKLARHLQEEGHKPMLVAADVQRPGAIEQLEVLGAKIGVPVFSIQGGDPVDICTRGRAEAQKKQCDVVIYDTAGRLAIDEALMAELARIQEVTAPQNVLLVIDAMIGQDSVKTASAFNERLGLTGVALTKLDGDARGGAALSVKEVTGAPIRFAGMGEGMDKLEPFRPEGMAGRILGFGDVVGLMKDFKGVIDEQKAQKDAQRILEGRFSLNDFLEQLRMVKSMGPIKDLFDKLPFFPDGLPEGINLDDKDFVKAEAIVSSMTMRERVETELFQKQPSRVRRVAKGSGRSEQDVAELLERFAMMKQMMGGLGQTANMLSRIPGMKQLATARRLKDAVRLAGLDGTPMANGLADELLQGLLSSGGPRGPGMFGAMAGQGAPNSQKKQADKQKKKNLRKMQKKSRKKGR